MEAVKTVVKAEEKRQLELAKVYMRQYSTAYRAVRKAMASRGSVATRAHALESLLEGLRQALSAFEKLEVILDLEIELEPLETWEGRKDAVLKLREDGDNGGRADGQGEGDSAGDAGQGAV